MIVHDSFSVSEGNQGGLNATLPSSCEELQSNKLDEYSDDSDAEIEKVRKAKKSKKTGNEKWSGSLICNLRPGHVCGLFFAFMVAQQFFTIAILCSVTKIVAIATLLGCDTAILVMKFQAPPYLFIIARCRRLGTS